MHSFCRLEHPHDFPRAERLGSSELHDHISTGSVHDSIDGCVGDVAIRDPADWLVAIAVLLSVACRTLDVEGWGLRIAGGLPGRAGAKSAVPKVSETSGCGGAKVTFDLFEASRLPTNA